jgi:hypothetical protein
LATSVDSFVNVRVDGNALPCALEIKTISNATTFNKAQTSAAAQLQKLTYFFSFGDALFKKRVKSQYRVQCIHHVCDMRVDLVLFVLVSNQNIIYMMLIKYQKTDLDMY